MAGKKQLVDALRGMKGAHNGMAAQLEEAREGWLQDLEKLRSKIQSWMEDAEKKGVLVSERIDVTISEEGMDEYDAPALNLHVPDVGVVHIRPIGMKIVGAMGRVDMISGGRHVRLLRVAPDQWVFQINWGSPRGQMLPVTAAKFRDAFLDVVQRPDFQPG